MRQPKPTLGWREWVTLPDLGSGKLRVKIDTGARTAALHVIGLDLEETATGLVAHFKLHFDNGTPTPVDVNAAPIVGFRRVRNPGGRTESRPVVSTNIQLGTHLLPALVTLTRRDDMGFQMLLGRQTIKGQFVVDPGRSYLISERPKHAE